LEENGSFSDLGSEVALLPDEVLWRRKEAFSDGVSGNDRSLYQILQEYCQTQIPEPVSASEAEKMYYRRIFDKTYPGLGSIVPYFWMPKYVEATDASARTLSIYRLDIRIAPLVEQS
jgi:asparagine synthase (glutamine-hydrolysing)